MAFEVVFRERLPQEVLDELDQHNATLSGYLDEQHKEDGSHGDVTADSVVVANEVTAGGAGTFGGDLTAWAGDPSRECALGDLLKYNPLVVSSDCVGLKIGSVEGYDSGAPVPGPPWFLLTTSQGVWPGRRVLAFVDGNQSDSHRTVAAALYYVPDGGGFGHYVFGPSPSSNFHSGGLDLGYPNTGRRIRNIYAHNISVINDINASNNIYANNISANYDIASVTVRAYDITANNTIAAANGFTERGRTVPMGEWRSYAPSWIATGAQPSVGTGGSISGRYTLIGNTMHVRVRITLGTGFSFGTGTHGVTFPNIGLTPVAAPVQMLTARYADIGTGTYVQTSYITPISGLVAMPFITGTGPIASVSSSSPFVFAAGDLLEIGGTVEVA